MHTVLRMREQGGLKFVSTYLREQLWNICLRDVAECFLEVRSTTRVAGVNVSSVVQPPGKFYPIQIRAAGMLRLCSLRAPIFHLSGQGVPELATNYDMLQLVTSETDHCTFFRDTL